MREWAGLKGSMRATQRIERAVGFLTLIFLSGIFIIPFLITLGDSLKSFLEIYAMPRVWIPRPPQWSNFADVFRVLPFHRFFINTICITTLSLFGQVGSAAIVAICPSVNSRNGLP